MQTLLQDIRYGLRMLAKNPGFTTVAVLSLALGIGANTTIFSYVNALLLRPPAVGDPDRLLEVWQHRSDRGEGLGSATQLSYPDYEYFRDHNQVFSAMAGFTGENFALVWNRSGEGETARGALVSANFFSMLDVRPSLGRGFLPDEDQATEAVPVAVISHAFWQQRLGSDPTILGKTLNLNGRASPWSGSCRHHLRACSSARRPTSGCRWPCMRRPSPAST